MAFTIFGAGVPGGVVPSADPSQISVSTAFYVLGVSGWRIQGIRFYIPPGTTIPDTGQKGYLWTGTGNSPTSEVSSFDFTGVTEGWNTGFFGGPITLTAGKFYWAQVYFPVGQYGVDANRMTSANPIQSPDASALYASAPVETNPRNCSYVFGAAGQAPALNFGSSWYGVDVIVDDGTGVGGPTAADSAALTDTVTINRTGLPTAVHANATATDPLGSATNSSVTLPVGSNVGIRTIERSMFETRIAWGSVVNHTTQGPDFFTDPAGAVTLGLPFSVQWPVRFTGCRIYKAPGLTGSIPIRLWGPDSIEIASETVNWVVDSGGWREITFSAPISLTPNVDYILSYYSPNSAYAMSEWVYQVWNDVVPPFVVKYYQDTGALGLGGSVFRTGTSQAIPQKHTANIYYIEPIVKWEDSMPGYEGGTEYYAQWVNGQQDHAFMVGVFFADAVWISDYASVGINTIVGGHGTSDYIAAMKATGMDHYPFAAAYDDPDRLALRAVAEDPAYAARVKGYYVIDEPDQFFPYTPPSGIREWCNDLRRLDSTRPLVIGMGRVVGINQTFYHQPQGSTMDQANELWRGWAALGDMVSGDFYTLASIDDPDARWGVWTYGPWTQRLRNLNDGKTPIWTVIESTSEEANQPTIEQVYSATWASLIAGAKAIVFFDHRFGNATVAKDFAHLLHNPPMRAMITDLCSQLQSLGPALHAAEAGLVTVAGSSNMTAGPRGGTYGVPMHYSTRVVGATSYLFAMGNRPGGTTGTFVIPDAAGKTLTVIGEGRTVTVNGSGVFSDSFPADYSVHLYQWAT